MAPLNIGRFGSGTCEGQTFPVGAPTTIHGLIEFQPGAVIALVNCSDVWQHDLANMALYGSEGTIHIPDPNFFGGKVRLTHRSEPAALPAWDHALGIPNRDMPWGRAALVAAGAAGRFIDLATTCTRPDPLGLSEASELMLGVRTAELTNLEG